MSILNWKMRKFSIAYYDITKRNCQIWTFISPVSSWKCWHLIVLCYQQIFVKSQIPIWQSTVAKPSLSSMHMTKPLTWYYIHIKKIFGVEFFTLSRLDFFQFILVFADDRTTVRLTMSEVPMVFRTVQNRIKYVVWYMYF